MALSRLNLTFAADSAPAKDGDAVFFGASYGFFAVDNDRFSGFNSYGFAASQCHFFYGLWTDGRQIESHVLLWLGDFD